MNEQQIINKLADIIESHKSQWSKVGNGIQLKNPSEVLVVKDSSKTVQINKVINL